jgi:hypothetical protein
VGSGTFVRWNDRFGILTAEHVPSYPPDARKRLNTSWQSHQRLRIMLDDRPSDFGFEARALQVVRVADRLSDEYGPDAAIIVLPPCDQLATLQRRKSFWNLTNNQAANMAGALDERGCIAIAGHPAEDVDTEAGPRGGFSDVTFAPGLVGFTGQTAYFDREGFDYIEVGSQRDDRNEAPFSYHGVSGGSLWRIPIMRRSGDPDTAVFFPNQLFLIGVPFFEIEEAPGRIRVRGHGPRTIYERLLPALPP